MGILGRFCRQLMWSSASRQTATEIVIMTIISCFALIRREHKGFYSQEFFSQTFYWQELYLVLSMSARPGERIVVLPRFGVTSQAPVEACICVCVCENIQRL